jgi:hypothetical protein
MNHRKTSILACLVLAASALATTVHADSLAASMDAYISIASPTTTFGTTDPNQLVTVDASAKSYILFDASLTVPPYSPMSTVSPSIPRSVTAPERSIFTS